MWYEDCDSVREEKEEILKALKWVVESWEKGDDIFGAIQQARDIISKHDSTGSK